MELLSVGNVLLVGRPYLVIKSESQSKYAKAIPFDNDGLQLGDYSNFTYERHSKWCKDVQGTAVMLWDNIIEFYIQCQGMALSKVLELPVIQFIKEHRPDLLQDYRFLTSELQVSNNDDIAIQIGHIQVIGRNNVQLSVNGKIMSVTGDFEDGERYELIATVE